MLRLVTDCVLLSWLHHFVLLSSASAKGTAAHPPAEAVCRHLTRHRKRGGTADLCCRALQRSCLLRRRAAAAHLRMWYLTNLKLKSMIWNVFCRRGAAG